MNEFPEACERLAQVFEMLAGILESGSRSRNRRERERGGAVACRAGADLARKLPGLAHDYVRATITH